MDNPDTLPTAVLFKIDPTTCAVCVGDAVGPGTPIGDACSGDHVLRASCKGTVEAINPCSKDRALFVWISPRGRE